MKIVPQCLNVNIDSCVSCRGLGGVICPLMRIPTLRGRGVGPILYDYYHY